MTNHHAQFLFTDDPKKLFVIGPKVTLAALGASGVLGAVRVAIDKADSISEETRDFIFSDAGNLYLKKVLAHVEEVTQGGDTSWQFSLNLWDRTLTTCRMEKPKPPRFLWERVRAFFAQPSNCVEEEWLTAFA